MAYVLWLSVCKHPVCNGFSLNLRHFLLSSATLFEHETMSQILLAEMPWSKLRKFFSDNSLHLSILHSWIAIPYMPTTAAKRPHAITTQKHNKIPMNLRCSLTMAFSLWFSYRASCLEPSSSSHCPWKCRRICDRLAFIDTISWITRFALPENSGSI